MANLLPNYLMRQWTPDGKPLSGGRMYFYFSGTNTPKTVYQDAGETIPHTNPVVLDASGHADIWLGAGAYRVHVFDSFIVQVAPPIDGINGESGAGSDPGVYFTTYADLRAVTDYPQTAYVHGNTSAGDGGQGWFERLPVTQSDDNGVILTAASGSIAYRRVFDAAIDPRWYGVKYGVALDQTVAHVDAMAASARHNVPMQVSGSIRLDQTVIVPAGASIVAEHDGFYTSSLNIPFTFSEGSSFQGAGRTFGVGVQPYFESGVVPSIPLSWMAEDSEDTRVSKWIISGSASNTQLDLDESPAIAIDIDIQSPLRQVGTSKFTWQAGLGALSLVVTKLLSPELVNGIFDIDSSITNVNTNFGAHYSQLEWFSGPNNRALYLAATYGRVELRERTYTIDTIPGLPGSLSIKGAGVLSLINGASLDVGCTDLQLLDCGILTSQPTQWFVGDFLNATNATFPSTYTASQVNLDGCYYVDDYRNPVYAGQPGLYNAHLPLVPSAAVVGTDTNGKLVQKSNTPLVYGGAVWDLVADVNIDIMRVKYVNGKWFVLGAAGAYAYSIDAEVWMNRTISNTAVTLQDIVWDGTYYVMVGYRTSDAWEAYAWRSLDGLNWSVVTLPSTFGGFPRFVRNIALFNGKLYVMSPAWRYVESSDHGATWTEVQYYNPGPGSYLYESTSGFAGVVNNQLWLCDGYGNSYYSAAPAGLGSFSSALSSPSFTTPKYVVDVSYEAPNYRFVLSNGASFHAATLPYSTTPQEASDYTVLDTQITDVVGLDGARILTVGVIYGLGSADGYIATNITKLGWMRRQLSVQSAQYRSVGVGDGKYLVGNSAGRIYRTI